MCDIDFDEAAKVWRDHMIGRARKEHTCDTCWCLIAAGDSYLSHFDIFDGCATDEKQCLRCWTIANAFTREHRWSVSPGGLYIRMCGNSVCPPLAAAIVRAQFDEVDLTTAEAA